MADELDVTAASSTATDGSAASSTANGPATSAETVNTDQGQPTYRSFSEHPDWQRMVRERNDARTSLQQMQQRLQQLEGAARPAPATGQPSAEETAAAEALHKLMNLHPELKQLLALAKAGPQLVRGYQGVEALTRSQQDNLVRSGRSEVVSLAKAAQLPTSEHAIDLMEEMVVALVRRDADATEKFLNGDLQPVRDAFKRVTEGFIADVRRQPAATLADTKNKTTRLPPAPRSGGAAGPEAPAKLEPGKEREFASALHRRAMEMLKG